MTRKPDLERSLVAVWDLLSESERVQMRRIAGFTPDWRPDLRQPLTHRQRLEGAEEIARIMPLPPGRLGQWKEELIQRNQPEKEGE